MVSAFTDAQTLGIRIYPVAASGADDLLEYTMRSAAEVTGGRYPFSPTTSESVSRRVTRIRRLRPATT